MKINQALQFQHVQKYTFDFPPCKTPPPPIFHLNKWQFLPPNVYKAKTFKPPLAPLLLSYNIQVLRKSGYFVKYM